jgi:hypothetical protein
MVIVIPTPGETYYLYEMLPHTQTQFASNADVDAFPDIMKLNKATLKPYVPQFERRLHDVGLLSAWQAGRFQRIIEIWSKYKQSPEKYCSAPFHVRIHAVVVFDVETRLESGTFQDRLVLSSGFACALVRSSILWKPPKSGNWLSGRQLMRRLRKNKLILNSSEWFGPLTNVHKNFIDSVRGTGL